MQAYDEKLIAHSKMPLNRGRLRKYDVVYSLENETCGDGMSVYLRMTGNRLDGIKFDGKGCVVSIAAASMVSQYVKGKTVKEIMDMDDESLKRVLDVKIERSRLRCANLFLRAVKRGLRAYSSSKGTDSAA